jgi:diguanylate cyclase (GGDEF)-like protein/PAS domain S-box-containing protein
MGVRARDQDAADAMSSGLAVFTFAMELQPLVRAVYVSASVEEYLGYTATELQADPGSFVRVLAPKEQDALRGAAHWQGGEQQPFRMPMRRRDGQIVWAELVCLVESSPEGRLMLFGAARDISALRAAEVQVRAVSERYDLLSENSMDVVYSAGVDRVITWISPSVERALGWKPDDLIGRLASVLVHPEDLQALMVKQDEIIKSGGTGGSAELRIATADGGWRWMRVRGRVVRDDDGAIIGGIDELRDMQAEMDLRVDMARGLEHDGLTGVANRALALRRISTIIDRERDGEWALLCVGIDGMTRVNEAFGYTAGDRVLAAVAQRLVDVTGAADRVARVAGDEFVVLLPEASTTAAASASAAERILEAIRGAVTIGPYDIDVTACVGIAAFVDGGAEELLRDATMAMRQASSHGTDRWGFLDTGLAAFARSALTVQNELRDALREGRVHAWFQPVVSLADRSLQGYEALVRWIREDGTVVPPDEFLPVAARTDLILAVDSTVLAQAFDALATLPEHLTIAVNVSAATLTRGDLCEEVKAHVARTGVRPSRLHLEVTETSLINVTDAVLHTMRTLESGGVAWWIDDFGTGYSSISHVRDMPLAGVKLDRSFSTGIGAGLDRDLHLAKGVAGLAEGLGLRTIAEGVETEEEATTLARLGWAVGQGWLFGRPAPLPRP